MTVTTDGLPASIRIGPHDIKITRAAEIEGGEDFGGFCMSSQEITVLNEFGSGTLAVDTLIHEMLHGAWAINGLPEHSTEELIVANLATALTQIFRDHPELVVWIQTTLAK